MKDMLVLAFAICLLVRPQVGCAQAPPSASTASSPVNSQSLAAALDSAILPTHRIFFTVSAEKVALPPDNTMPPANSSLTDVTGAYKRSVRAFGAVTAIAPPTMVILNTRPADADIYAGLQAEQAFKLLAARLNDSQWHALTGEGGLGLSDLNDDDQRRFFQTLFPGNSLQVNVSHPTVDMPDGQRDLSAELPQVRLRLGQSVQISLPQKGQPNSSVGGATAPSAYVWNPSYTISFGGLPGVQQSAMVPNVLKASQLNWNLPVLRTLIPFAGLKTVGDLMTRIGQMTHLEFYADKHFEGQSLTVIGAETGSAPASDLLRALAFCVTGAFRQVGPAFVLTDDVIGVATRRKILENFSHEMSLDLKKKLTEAGDILVTKRSLQSLSVFGSPLAPTTAQWKAIWASALPGTSYLSTDLSMDQLTAAQQTSVREEAQRLAQMAQEHPDMNIPPTDLTGKMHLQVHPRLELLLPSLDSPVTTTVYFFDLFQASNKLQRALSKSSQAPKLASASGPPPITLAQAMQMTARRAVLVQPQTLADLDSTITTMQRLGFNQLWLDAFSQGRTHLTSSEGKGDLLTEAIKKTRGTGIQVFAVMDLFGWNKSAPTEAVDLTVLGETSVQDDARQQQNALDEADADGYMAPPDPPAKSLSVTPLAPDVQERLMTLVRSLARRPGLAGFVWRRTAPPGYIAGGNSFYGGGSSPLGYTEGARLTFLRQQHADPIDISEPTGIISDISMIVNGNPVVSGIVTFVSAGNVTFQPNGTTLPNFDDSAIDTTLSQAWDKYKAEGDLACLRRLCATVSGVGTASKPVILVEQRRDTSEEDWYGLWSSPRTPMPEWKMTAESGGMNQIDRLAKSQSPVALLALDTDDLHGFTGLAALVHHQMLGKTWDGFALDMTLPGAPALDTLEQILKTSPTTK